MVSHIFVHFFPLYPRRAMSVVLNIANLILVLTICPHMSSHVLNQQMWEFPRKTKTDLKRHLRPEGGGKGSKKLTKILFSKSIQFLMTKTLLLFTYL